MPVNKMIEEIAKEYEGLTYNGAMYDEAEAEEEGYKRIDNTAETQEVQSESNNNVSGTDTVIHEQPKAQTWEADAPICSKCSYKSICNAPCALIVDYELEEHSTSSENER